jgi:aldehyde:ferredoxin oxidoreductase
MAKGGYVGKILYINLTDKTTKEIPTADYEQWGGGHGIGSALFWDLVPDKTIDGYNPGNLVTMMASPFSGTGTPSASGRTEVQGIGIQAYPIPWFTRSNFGGRFAGQLKFAGWDGIAIQGASDKPVWINIVNDKVTIEDASALWGLNTHEAQEEIWTIVSGSADVRSWYELSGSRDGGRTTQKPAVVAIGPAGENKNRNACLIHDSGNGSGQGGFGGVLGSKNLKAVSVIGTKSVPIADPAALVKLRLEIQKQFGYNVDAPTFETPVAALSGMYGLINGAPGYGPILWTASGDGRPQGCMGCFKNCRNVFPDGLANGDQCVEGLYWSASGNLTEQRAATTLLDQMGINVYDLFYGHPWMYGLYKRGILGPGKQINSNLPWDKYNTFEFIKAFTEAVAHGTDIGADLKDGVARAAVKWGLWDQETSNGNLTMPQWGFSEHYDPRLEVEWSYGSLFGDRDINEHGVNWHVHWMPTVTAAGKQAPIISAEEMAKMLAEATGVGDPKGWDYSAEGIYADPKLKAVQWHRHYTRYYKQSLGMCDWAWPMLINYNAGADHKGATPTYEPKLFEAVTGTPQTWQEGLAVGERIWNLDRAIWVLQGRTRELEIFTNYVFDVPTKTPYFLPAIEDGKWTYSINLGRTLDRAKFDEMKTRFYSLNGWDPKTGWPTKSGLSKLGLDKVAAELEKAGKLGAAG